MKYYNRTLKQLRNNVGFSWGFVIKIIIIQKINSMTHINTYTCFVILKTDCKCITIILDTSHEKYMVMFLNKEHFLTYLLISLPMAWNTWTPKESKMNGLRLKIKKEKKPSLSNRGHSKLILNPLLGRQEI